LVIPILEWLSVSIPIFIILVFVIYWIPNYYESMLYTLTSTEIVWKRGVWFRKTGIVPYNRITNVDINQGPISRSLKVAHLGIQTAGYSGTSQPGGRLSEIRIEGMIEYEKLRDQIMSFVRKDRPVATESHYAQDGESRIISELSKIRELLEKMVIK